MSGSKLYSPESQVSYLKSQISNLTSQVPSLISQISNLTSQVSILKSHTSYLIIFILGISTLTAQDIHFSQFEQSPLNLNPAKTGLFNGDYRFAGNHRNQWSSITVPYVTFSASADARVTQFKLKKAFLGIGLLFNTDKAGDGNFGTNQIILSLAYHRVINTDSTFILSLGGNFGYNQNSVDYNKFYFGNQYNGSQFDSNLSNDEYFSQDNLHYFDFSLGVNAMYELKNHYKLNLGIAFIHLNSPKKSFYDSNQSELPNKYNFHSSIDIPIKNKHSIVPSVVYYKQGTFNELYLGGKFRYALKDVNFKNLYAGIWSRTGDAAIFMLGMDYKSWNFGISYDVNYSKLRTVSNGQGGYEISLIYIFSRPEEIYVPKKYQCPGFM